MLHPSLVVAAELRIAVLGDSLVAGHGISPSDAFPAKLEKRIAKDYGNVKVINAGVSGDTTAGALQRLDWVLKENPQIVIVELGANDMLRGLAPAAAQHNLDAIIAALRQRGILVVLTGMMAAKNLGVDYERQFNAIYPALAKKHNLPFYPFFLNGIALNREYNLGDGVHPNAAGVDVIVEGFYPTLAKVFQDLAAGKPTP